MRCSPVERSVGTGSDHRRRSRSTSERLLMSFIHQGFFHLSFLATELTLAFKVALIYSIFINTTSSLVGDGFGVA